ncbi:MAG: hypothetical protein PHE24_04810 [Patescibacteria group bacterium]|nr:hypothetical protein [Patescibacteria group bacterium]
MEANFFQALKNSPLDQLGDVFKMLADKVFAHRRENKGYVPLAIFPYCVGIGGIYPCVEMIVEVRSLLGTPIGYALKKRSAEEQAWQGKYQIVGVAGRITDQPKNIFNRLTTEIFGQNKLAEYKKADFIGIEIHDEPERQATCWTAVWKISIRKNQFPLLSGDWKIFNQFENDGIIDHHRKTLGWAANPAREVFVDLR